MADVFEKDAGFCSGGEDDDIEAEDGIHSPTDASEDSVDVKVQAISFRNRNKRKCAEPRKLDPVLPAKKRKIDLTAIKNEEEISGRSPFRPWSDSPQVVRRIIEPFIQVPFKGSVDSREFDVISVSTLPSSQCLPGNARCHHVSVSKLPTDTSTNNFFSSSVNQEEPLPLVAKAKEVWKASDHVAPANPPEDKRETDGLPEHRVSVVSPVWCPPHKDCFPVPSFSALEPRANERLQSYQVKKNKLNGRTVAKTCSEKRSRTEGKKTKPDEVRQSDDKFRIDGLLPCAKANIGSGAQTTPSKSSQGGHHQRNYKNMTRERRIEANARERTRVHTISAAFDTLRHSIPAYSHNQKLSKLSVLRIACSYIMTLSRLAGHDYSRDHSQPDLASCVENVSKTIQTEGKIRKKRED